MDANLREFIETTGEAIPFAANIVRLACDTAISRKSFWTAIDIIVASRPDLDWRLANNEGERLKAVKGEVCLDNAPPELPNEPVWPGLRREP